MKIYDITQELFTGEVYPGDVPPTYIRKLNMREGAPCNVTVLNMCAHNGTHVDAPYHFFEEGKSIEQLDLTKCIGNCTVVKPDRQPNVALMKKILERSEKRLLIKGNVVVTIELAKLMNEYNLELIGIEGQSVGTLEAPREVHLELLGKEVVILEGIRLKEVPEGNYLLSAAPIKLGGSDGAPCRAVLIEL